MTLAVWLRMMQQVQGRQTYWYAFFQPCHASSHSLPGSTAHTANHRAGTLLRRDSCPLRETRTWNSLLINMCGCAAFLMLASECKIKMWTVFPFQCGNTCDGCLHPVECNPQKKHLADTCLEGGNWLTSRALCPWVSLSHEKETPQSQPRTSPLNVSRSESLMGSSPQQYLLSHASCKNILVNIKLSSKYWILDWLTNSISRLSCSEEQTLMRKMIGLLNTARLPYLLPLDSSPAGCWQGYYSNLN